MAERKTGAGSFLGGVLEQARPPRSTPEVEPEATPGEPGAKGRGAGAAPKSSRAPASRAAKRIKGRTVYIPDDLWERLIVQSHRRDVTISDYVCLLLDRHVPDHRVVKSAPAADEAEPAA